MVNKLFHNFRPKRTLEGVAIAAYGEDMEDAESHDNPDFDQTYCRS